MPIDTDVSPSIYDVIEKAGHNFTLLASQVGRAFYWCEGCGAVLGARRGLTSDALFQAPKGSLSTLVECPNQQDRSTPFKDRLLAQDRGFEIPFLPPGNFDMDGRIG